MVIFYYPENIVESDLDQNENDEESLQNYILFFERKEIEAINSKVNT